MQTLEARRLLQTLLEGVDPASGQALPAGNLLQQAPIRQALLAALAALEQAAQREQRRRALPANTGRPWREPEQEQMLAAFRAGTPAEVIAHELGRTLGAIEARLELLGVLTADQRRTRSRFPARAAVSR